MRYFLGIDAGTSGIKAIVLSEDGEIAGTGYKECGDLITLRPQWVEQDPRAWWEACISAVNSAVSKNGIGRQISAIGLTGQMLGTVCTDRELNPIGNCMIWLDQRATAERDFIENALEKDEMLSITANYPLTGYWAPKLLWIKKNAPDVFERIYKVLFPKDYLRLKLTGEIATEVSDASGSFLFDVFGRKWSDKLFKEFGLPTDIVPSVMHESSDIAGYLREDAADVLSLKPGIPVVAGGGDQTAGAIGNGVTREGVISATIGTSGVVFAAMNKCIADKLPRAALSFCHSIPNMWSFFGTTLAAGGSFKWLRDTVFANEKRAAEAQGKDIYYEMAKHAAAARPGSEGLCFLPYLNGERTPYPDPNASGVFFGITYRTSLNELCRSVMEGVTYSLRDTIEILREYRLDLAEVRASGGGARSELWRQMQADIYNAVVLTTNLEEGPSAGAAILAAAGCGAFDSIPQACGELIRIKTRTEPIRRNAEIYEDYYKTYRALYPMLKDQYAVQMGLAKKWSDN